MEAGPDGDGDDMTMLTTLLTTLLTTMEAGTR